MRFAVLAAICLLALRGEDVRTAAKDPVGLARFVQSHWGFDWGPLYAEWGLDNVDRVRRERPGCSAERIRVLEPDQTIVLISSQHSAAELYARYRNGKFAGA